MKTVLITGASRGIGAACAKEFAKKGYYVIINYFKSKQNAINLVSEIKEFGGISLPLYGDISKERDVEKMYVYLKNIGCLPQILINNAGIAMQKLLTNTSLNDWNYVFQTNITGMFLCCKQFLPPMLKNKFGKIVNISSIWGILGASCEVAYSASKAAVIGFTKSLAKEVAPSNVFVNCVAPGVVDTQMNQNLSCEEIIDLENRISLKYFANVRDVSKAVLFLASDQASYITGQILNVDGGFLG